VAARKGGLMSWPLSVAMLAAVFLGAAVAAYEVSNRAQAASERIVALHAEIKQEEERIRSLTAEWAYLNHGSRLRELAMQHAGTLQLRLALPEQLLPLRSGQGGGETRNDR